jgi:hypothetical protein
MPLEQFFSFFKAVDIAISIQSVLSGREISSEEDGD